MNSKPKSRVVLLSVSPEDGIKCVDTNFDVPKVLMANSVYEIAHCGVDVSKERIFTCIVGTKGSSADFFCHVFKCQNKDIVGDLAAACPGCLAHPPETHRALARPYSRRSVSHVLWPRPVRPPSKSIPLSKRQRSRRVCAVPRVLVPLREPLCLGPRREGFPMAATSTSLA